MTARGRTKVALALTALAMTSAYMTKMKGNLDLDAANPLVLVGLLLGCMLPFRFSALAMGPKSRPVKAINRPKKSINSE